MTLGASGIAPNTTPLILMVIPLAASLLCCLQCYIADKGRGTIVGEEGGVFKGVVEEVLITVMDSTSSTATKLFIFLIR